jgi:hypothetical protein
MARLGPLSEVSARRDRDGEEEDHGEEEDRAVGQGKPRGKSGKESIWFST